MLLFDASNTYLARPNLPLFSPILNCRKDEDEDWDWATDVKKEDNSKPKKSSSSASKKHQPKPATQNEDLLIDFGNAEKKVTTSNSVAGDSSWASWENDAWESLNK